MLILGDKLYDLPTNNPHFYLCFGDKLFLVLNFPVAQPLLTDIHSPVYGGFYKDVADTKE